MANLADSISAGIKDAMRAKDRERLSALRDIKSKIMLEATKGGAGNVVDDATTLAILSKLLKQRNETAALYTDQGRGPRCRGASASPGHPRILAGGTFRGGDRSEGDRNHCLLRRLLHGRHGQSDGTCDGGHGRPGRRQGHLGFREEIPRLFLRSSDPPNNLEPK